MSEIAESVRRAVAGLPAAQALSARRYYLEGRPGKEIARLRRVPYNTAASDLHRARQRLREDLSV